MTKIGDNNPPPDAAFSMAIDDLYDEAKNFVDGNPIATQGEAEACGKLISEIKKIRKAADEARAEEKRPHDEAGKAVQAKYKPILEKADRAVTTIGKPLTAWLKAEEDRQREEARLLAEQADEAARAAQAAHSNAASLDDAERADELAKEAERLSKAAGRADKAKAQVAGVDRAIGLRTSWTASVTDYGALLAYMKKARPDDLKEILRQYATSQVNAGARHIPGVLIEKIKKVA